MHTNRNIYSHTETIHTPTTGAQSHRITHTSTQYYTRSHINNHTSQTHPHKATHTVPHTVIRTHPSQGHIVIHNNRHFPLQPRPFSLNRQYSVFIPAQTSRRFTSNLPCKASVVRNSSETNTQLPYHSAQSRGPEYAATSGKGSSALHSRGTIWPRAGS